MKEESSPPSFGNLRRAAQMLCTAKANSFTQSAGVQKSDPQKEEQNTNPKSVTETVESKSD